jgi:hypothetical protein
MLLSPPLGILASLSKEKLPASAPHAPLSRLSRWACDSQAANVDACKAANTSTSIYSKPKRPKTAAVIAAIPRPQKLSQAPPAPTASNATAINASDAGAATTDATDAGSSEGDEGDAAAAEEQTGDGSAKDEEEALLDEPLTGDKWGSQQDPGSAVVPPEVGAAANVSSAVAPASEANGTAATPEPLRKPNGGARAAGPLEGLTFLLVAAAIALEIVV